MRIQGLLLATATLVLGTAASARAEQLGRVDFSVSCAPEVGPQFERGVALLHDFWYDEAQRQFERIARVDPGCAMAHWGIAMSLFHEIWDRPDAPTLARGREEMRKAATLAGHASARERRYLAALTTFYAPGAPSYQQRVEAYSRSMEALYRRAPRDPDAGAFYALSILAAEAPDDTSLEHERRALAVLEPLLAAHPEHPGLVHYTIHACDSPVLAVRGLAAARRYGAIAPSAAHAVHMPGHLFARLGLWREDIEANAGSVRAAQTAQAAGTSDGFDQFHADDFLVYAYLQTGDAPHARAVIEESRAVIERMQSDHSGAGAGHSMHDMFGYYRTKLPLFYALETRDWPAAAALEPVEGASAETRTLTYWGRIIADGHLKDAAHAQRDLAAYEALWDEVKRGPRAYLAELLATTVRQDEVRGWDAYAEGDPEGALAHLTAAADLQDRVGQGEVDIPAREMLADMLAELHRPREALEQYAKALALSPNRFNGLYGAGRAAEGAGDAPAAARYYQTLLATADVVAAHERAEIEHAQRFLAEQHAAR